MQARESVSLRQVGVGTFFVFRNLEEMLCVLWALSLIECVTVGALKLPVPPTDALKTHSPQRLYTKIIKT